MATMIPIVIGARGYDADTRVARIVLWLLSHQAELAKSSIKLTINCGAGGIKYSVESWYEDKADGSAA